MWDLQKLWENKTGYRGFIADKQKISKYNNLRPKVDAFGLMGVPPSPGRFLNHSDATKPPLDAPFVPHSLFMDSVDGKLHGTSGWTKAMQYLGAKWVLLEQERRERSNKGINFLMPWSCIFQWPSHASWNWVLLFGSLRAPKCPEIGKLAQKSLSWLKILSRFDSRRIKC